MLRCMCSSACCCCLSPLLLLRRYTTNDLGVHGIGFIIQSDKFDASHLALQVELFVQDTLKRISTLPEVRLPVYNVWQTVHLRPQSNSSSSSAVAAQHFECKS